MHCSRSYRAVRLFVSSFKVALSLPIPASYVIGRFFSRKCCKISIRPTSPKHFLETVKKLTQENLRKRHGTNRWATLAKIGPAKIEFQSSFGFNNRAQLASRSVGRSADPLHQNIKGGAAPFLGGFVPELIRKSDIFGE